RCANPACAIPGGQPGRLDTTLGSDGRCIRCVVNALLNDAASAPASPPAPHTASTRPTLPAARVNKPRPRWQSAPRTKEHVQGCPTCRPFADGVLRVPRDRPATDRAIQLADGPSARTISRWRAEHEQQYGCAMVTARVVRTMFK